MNAQLIDETTIEADRSASLPSNGSRRDIQPTHYKTFDLNQPIDLPVPLTWHTVDGAYLFIAPEHPNWLTTDRLGAALLMAISWGETPRSALEFVRLTTGESQATLLEALGNVLLELETRQFYANAVLDDPEPEPEPTKRMLHIYLTRGCNLHCPQCYMAAGKPMQNELNTEDWCRAIDRFTQFNGPSTVSISGGEPMLREDFFAIAAYARRQGHQLVLLSNGTLIQDAATARRTGELFDRVQISLDGATPALHDKFRGQGSFERTVRAIHLLGATDVDIRISVTVMPQNAQDLMANLAPLLSTFPGKNIAVSVNNAFAEGRAALANQRFIPDPTASKKAIAIIMAQLRARGWDASTPRTPFMRRKRCGYGAGVILAPNGEVHPCPILNHPIGNIHTIPLSEIAEKLDQLYVENDVDQQSECVVCDLRYICGGGCRQDNLRINGDLRQTVCSQEYKDNFYRQLVASCESDQ